MRVMHCIGRIRACSFCGHRFWDTDETIFAEEDAEEIMLCCAGDNEKDQMICVNGWKSIHPEHDFNFVKKKLAEAEAYFTWPPELARVS